jgi:lycopene beta-cyclase
LADANSDRDWAPNYGVWQDEWEAVSGKYKSAGVSFAGGNEGNAIDRQWKVTDCFFGGSFDIPIEQRTRLDRPYFRVDKKALRDSLTTTGYRILQANSFSKATGVNIYSPAGSLVHDEDGTTMQLQKKDKTICSVRCKLVIDCTGHETSLVLRDTRDSYRPPGFQIAYGVLVDVEDDPKNPSKVGPYDKEAMTLFDYRTDHYPGEEEKKLVKSPTFMYAMPLKNNQIFFEETSLVARPAVSFQECKDRCFKRLEHLNIKVTNIYEEEFCYIPMGGALPVKDQRVIALGGSASIVHPSTGYNLCRTMMAAADVALALQKEHENMDHAAASAYHAIWSPGNIRQRNFAVFGGEFLMKQNVVGLRGFFDGFFRLPLELWGGFLAGWPGLPNNDKHETWLARIIYGVTFLTKLPPVVALDMIASIVSYSIDQGTPLLQSVTPFFGEPGSYEYKRNNDRVGDVAAKDEARRMLTASKVEEVIPVAFETDNDEIGSDDTAVVESSATLPAIDTVINIDSQEQLA